MADRTRVMSFIKDPTFLINLSGFLDLFGVSMVIPLLMPHVTSLAASPTVAGVYGSVYGAVQLFSSPAVGQWSDVVGCRVSLIISLAVVGAGYGLTGMTSSLVVLFLARVPIGIFKHSQTIAKSYLAAITVREKHAQVFGQFNSAASIGFILGPLVGGHIAEWPGGFRIAGALTALVFVLNAAMLFFLLPEPPTRSEDTAAKESKGGNFSLGEMVRAFRAINWDSIWDLFLIKFLLGFSIIVFRSSFSLMTKTLFDSSPRTIGYMTSYSGLIGTLCGFCVGKVAQFYGNNGRLMLHMSILQLITLLCLSLSHNIWWMVGFLAPLSFSTTVNRVTSTALTIHRGSEDERGALLGMSQSVMSIARMIAPLLGGIVMEYSLRGPLVVGSVITLVAVGFLIVFPQTDYRPKTKTS